MDKTLIEKLRVVIEQHQKETGERVTNVYPECHLELGGKARIKHIQVSIEK